MWIADWTSLAACKETDPAELFVRGAAQNRAKLICRGCPVQPECLADALDNEIEFGIWGGMTVRERSALLRRRPDVRSWRVLLEEERWTQASPWAPSSPPSIAEFEACYKTELNSLVRFLIRQGVSYNDSDDAAQSAFTEAFRQWLRIQNPRAWLRRVAIRSIKHLPEYPTRDMPSADRQSLISDPIEMNEQSRQVIEMLAKLPPQQRAAMAWAMDGFSPKEIAEEIGSTPAAVRQSLRRARQTLKDMLSRMQEEGQ
jgi:RNA polymerase sigma factor (sigma-70 family)